MELLALTDITEREDPQDHFTRTALVLKFDKVHSIDVIAPTGELFCRLNITCPKPDGSWGNVDVIWNPLEQVGEVGAWTKGERILNRELEGSLVSVDIRKGGK